MDICSDGHEEFCYEVIHCPLCTMIQKIEELELDKQNYEKEVETLKDEIFTMNKEA